MYFMKKSKVPAFPDNARQQIIGKFDTPIPEKLLGTWISTYGEINDITNTTYSTDTGYGGYAGTIVNHRDDGPSAGYITIQFTQNDSDPGAIGKYYVLRYYVSLVSSTLSIIGAYSGNDPDFNYPKGGGKPTREEAEEVYTARNGYFGSHTFPNNLEGHWVHGSVSSGSAFTVSDRIIQYSYYGTPVYIGEIVKVQDNGATGYLVFKFIFIYEYMADRNLKDKYSVLHWEDYDTETASMAHGGGNPDWNSIAVSPASSIQEAEDIYINGAYPFNRRYFTLQ